MDPVSNMLTSIRNAQAVQKDIISVPFSDLKYQIARILAKKGFIEKTEKKGRKTKKFIEIGLKYDNGAPKISGLRKVSKPGQRIYKKFKEIKLVKGGYGMAIISTSKGLMTNKEARKEKLGGEVICEVW
jgi:small subunit ribosomal protein S8